MDCLDEVTRRLAKQLTTAEVADIYFRMLSKVSRQQLKFDHGVKIANENTYDMYKQRIKGISPDKDIQAYAQEVFQEAVNEKKETLRREYLQAERNDANINYVQQNGKNGHVKALNVLMVGHVEGTQNILTLEGRKNGILDIDMAEMYRAFDEYMHFFGLKNTEEQGLNIAREMDVKGSTDDKAARKLVETWEKIAERARTRKNELGANIRILADWRLPQSWDPAETKHFGLSVKERAQLLMPNMTEQARNELYNKAKAGWIEEAFKRVNREKYMDMDSITPLNDEDLRDTLGNIFQSIVTRGLSDDPIVGSPASLAKRLSYHRELHFKSAMDWYEFNKLTGTSDIMGIMQKSLINNARDIALLETFGPNPQLGFQTALVHAEHYDAMAGRKYGEGVWRANIYFNEITGASRVPVSEGGEIFASAVQGLNHWMVATKLGSVLLSQVNDVATYEAIAASNGLGMGKALKFAVREFNVANKEDRKALLWNGIAAQTVINDVGMRYGESVKGVDFTSRMANYTMRLSGTEAWTDNLKRGFQRLIAFHLNEAVVNGREKIDPLMEKMFKRYGIGDAEWEIIRKAQPVELSGEMMITPMTIKMVEDSPAAREAAIKVAAMMHEEANIAVITPGARESALMKFGTTSGTAMSAVAKSFALFKTFTLSLSTKVLPRIWQVEKTSNFKAGLAAKYALGMMIAGAMSYQLKQLAFGRNPRDMETSEFWMAAAAQSGGLGILGDFLFSDYNRFGGDIMSTLGGPVGALVSDFTKLTIGNARQKLMGKDTHMAAETFQFMKNQTPLINLWYTRAALDHLLFFHVQEAMNPGYLRRMRSRVEKENDQTFWYKPQDTLPEEAPDLGYAIGGSSN